MYEVMCKLSNEGSDVRCPVCGQGFLVYWARFSRAEQLESRRHIQQELRTQHDAGGHPHESFSVFEPFPESGAEAEAARLEETHEELQPA